jgi:Cof subfamily protein (haloacid dehalogenase superfamily)
MLNLPLNLPRPDNIKALAFDLDGTILAPGAVLTERTITAVNKCVKKGLKIVIATGRAIESSESFRAPIGAKGPMIYYNGAMVSEMPECRILKAALLDRIKAGHCVDISRETGIYCQMYLLNGKKVSLLTEQDGPERKMYYKHSGILAELEDLKETLDRSGASGCVKAMFLAEPETLAELRPRLEDRLGGGVYIAQTLRTFLEIMDAKASKGQALSFVMDRLSLKRDEVIAFGDEENDVPMFAEAGFSVAPSNAKDSVKAKAGMVIGSNAEDGVAVFLEEFFAL